MIKTITDEDFIAFKTIVECLKADKTTERASYFINKMSEKIEAFTLSAILEVVKIYREEILLHTNKEGLDFLIKNILSFKKLTITAEYNNTAADYAIAYKFYKSTINDLNLQDFAEKHNIQLEPTKYIIIDEDEPEETSSITP